MEYAWLLGAVLLAVPHSGEIFGLVADLQWIMAPALALALVSRRPNSMVVRANEVIFVAVASLSGPFCIFATPLALWRITHDHSRHARLLATVVILAAIMQGWTIFVTEPPEFGGAQSPIRFALLLADRWLGQISHGAAQTQSSWQIAMLTVVAIGIVVALLPRDRRTTFLLLYLVAALILGATWGKFKRSSEWEWFSNPDFSDRYFYVPRLIVIWSLIALIADVRSRSIFGILAAGAIAANCSALWIKPVETHLPWKEAAGRIDRGEGAHIPIIPKPWFIEVPAPYKAEIGFPAELISAPTCRGSVDDLHVSRPLALYGLYMNAKHWLAFQGMPFIKISPTFRPKVYLTIQGWIMDVRGNAPDNIFIALTAPDGTRSLHRAVRVPREDIRVAFKQPALPDVGFALSLDMSDVRGTYSVGIVGGYQGNLSLCPQFNAQIDVN